MSAFRTLTDVTAAYVALAPPDVKGDYRLDRMRKLLKAIGDPQERSRVIHIAGTSGKTSTAYFIRGLLEAAGQRTGLTISPHITAVNERVQVAGGPLEPAKFVTYANEFSAIVADTGLRPTYFEMIIALAYWVFAKEEVDYAVVETGLGGLLDATNLIIRPDKVCVITDIGLDHTDILGDTLLEIARQKAGIIQPGNVVFMRRQEASVTQAVADVAKAKNAMLNFAVAGCVPRSLPALQRHNWSVASAAFEYVRSRDSLPAVSLAAFNEVATQMPPGRYEVYHYNNKTIILDGAHNPQKLLALRDSLGADALTSIAVLANMTTAPAQKIRESAAVIKLFTSHLIVPEFSAGQDISNRRSLPAETFAAEAKAAGITSIEIKSDPLSALRLLLARPEKVLVITGSFFLVCALRDDLRRLLEYS